MRENFFIVFMTLFMLLFSACGSVSSDSSETNSTQLNNPSESQTIGDVVFEETTVQIPTLVVIMNWTDYSENNPQVWYDKIFNKNANSVNRWYYDSSDANIELVPVNENSGISNDGIVTVGMNEAHPGGYSDISFRDTQIKNAIESFTVNSAIDFKSYDTNGDGGISRSEMQIIFIVAGGEESYGDSTSNSIWAHSWSFESNKAPKLDDVYLMRAASTTAASGNYSKFGATHSIGRIDEHKASIGIIAHELGHSLFNLEDLYNDSYGHSGLGYYDIMSGGSWGRKTIDDYEGDTPTQFSAYSKIDTGINTDIVTITPTSSGKEIVLKCSSNEYLKLTTASSDEYFLLECRDSARVDSDRTFYTLDSTFTENRLFALLYHVDENKFSSTALANREEGTQSATNHYAVRLVERDTSFSLTSTDGVKAKFSDAYTQGQTIDSEKTKSYSGTLGYNILVDSSDYANRTMTFKITR